MIPMTALSMVVIKEAALPTKIAKRLALVFLATALPPVLDVELLMVVPPRTNLLATLLLSCVLPVMATLDQARPRLVLPLLLTVTRTEVVFLVLLILLVGTLMEDASMTNLTVILQQTFASTTVPVMNNAKRLILATPIVPVTWVVA